MSNWTNNLTRIAAIGVVAGSFSSRLSAQEGRTIAPALPAVAPDDADGNRVSDALDARLDRAAAGEPVRIIVSLRDRARAAQLTALTGLDGSLGHVYKNATYGFSATMPAAKVRGLANLLGPDLIQISADVNGVASTDFSTVQIRARDGDTSDADGAFAWTYGYDGSPDIAVAIAGSGIRIDHQDLGNGSWGNAGDPVVAWHDSTFQRWTSPEDINGHETLVAGIVGGRGNVDATVVGVAPSTNLVGLKCHIEITNADDACDPYVGVWASDFIAAADWVLSGDRFAAVSWIEFLSYVDFDGDGDYVDEETYGTRSVPALGDLDGDGDLDMLVGSADGTMHSATRIACTNGPCWQHDEAFATGLPSVNPFAAPALADIDGDGDLDLMVGQDNSGNGVVLAWRNTGSASSPAWSSNMNWTIFSADPGDRPAPALGDLDGDGDPDLLVGKANGAIDGYAFNGTVFALTSSLTSGLSTVGANAQPALSDLDFDGDLDLVVGLQSGQIIAHENTGGVNAPSWSRNDLLIEGIAPLLACGYAAPALADMDGDGDDDVMMGKEGGTLLSYRRETATTMPRDDFNIMVLNISSNWPAASGCFDVEWAVETLIANGIVVTCSAGNGHHQGANDAYYHVTRPATSEKVIAVGGTTTFHSSADNDIVSGYSANGDPSDPTVKPDVVAPGGGQLVTGGTIQSADGRPCQSTAALRQGWGTSYAAPHVAGLAALIIDAQQAIGDPWTFTEAEVLEVKAIIQMTATETVLSGENVNNQPQNPTLDRGGKDRVEGYGRVNADAAVEAVTMTWDRSSTTATLGAGPREKKCWARQVTFTGGGPAQQIALTVPDGADFDLYLYDMTPGPSGEPVITHTSATDSTDSGGANDEFITVSVQSDTTYYALVKWVEGDGTFTISCGTAPAQPEHHDDFDAYEPGGIVGQGGWSAWNDDPVAGEFLVTDEIARSMPQSLEIDGLDDAVHAYTGFDTGQWQYSAWLYVPDEMVDMQAFILLNTYPASVPSDWSMAYRIDGATNEVSDFGSNALPLIRNAWAEIRVVIDLEQDVQWAYYNGDLLVTKPWTGGVDPGGAPRIGAVDLWAAGSTTPVFYDDLSLVPLAAPSCPADVDGDGSVGVPDLIQLMLTWGACNGCGEDINGDGFVDVLDLIEVLLNWGPCP